MALATWLKSEVGYGEQLVRSAVEGARAGSGNNAEPLRSVLVRSARASWPWLMVGASIGLLASRLGNRRSKAGAAVCGVLLGAAVGFGANMARQLTEDTVRGAMKNVNSVRDAHWLATHPIDYA